MIRWNKTTALVTGMAMIVLGNAVALTGVYYNRSGTPDAEVTLTQRELRLPYSGGFESENSGITLNLNWRVKDDHSDYATNWGYPEWLNENKLSELGFDTSIPKTAHDATTRYRKMLPREAYIVLEYNGPAYEVQLQRVRENLRQQQQLAAEHPDDATHRTKVKQAEAAVANEENTFSHLFVVDAGVNKNELRQRYPDHHMYIIATAQIKIVLYSRQESLPSYLTGRIQGLSIDTITAPYAIRQRLEPYLAKNAYVARQKLKYKVTIAYGKRLEPWIEDLTVIQPDMK